MDATMFSRKIKERMSELNMTQAELTAKCQPYCSELGVKLSKKNVSQYVNGMFVPRHGKLTAICRALGVEEAYFVSDDVGAYLSPDEEALIRCWRKATLDEKETVAFALRKRGPIPMSDTLVSLVRLFYHW